jgi:phosphoglycolate phosphatase
MPKKPGIPKPRAGGLGSRGPGVYVARQFMPCRGVVFDKDGTLVDIWPMLAALAGERMGHLAARVKGEALDAVNKAIGFDPETGAIAPFGPLASAAKRDETAVAAGALWQKGIPWHQAYSIARDSYDEADRTLDITLGLRLLAGVEETLAALKASGLLLFVVTSDSHERTERMLSHLGILRCFSRIVGADEIARAKPDPEAVLLCASGQGLDPAKLVVVGDGPQDALMGRRAGSKTVGVLTGVSSYDDLEGYCDVVLPGVQDIRPGPRPA